MKRHDWPGNVRQLFNVLVQASVLTDAAIIDGRNLQSALGEMSDFARGGGGVLNQPLGDGFNLKAYLNEIHRSYLRRAMGEANGVKTHAARLLGMDNYQTLDSQLKKLGVSRD